MEAEAFTEEVGPAASTGEAAMGAVTTVAGAITAPMVAADTTEDQDLTEGAAPTEACAVAGLACAAPRLPTLGPRRRPTEFEIHLPDGIPSKDQAARALCLRALALKPVREVLREVWRDP